MIKTLQLNNFKPFGELQQLELAPITLIYGPNSGGKSSILQSLLLLKQTLSAEDQGVSLCYRGEYVDLGGFPTVVHRHNETLRLQLGMQFQLHRRGPAPTQGFLADVGPSSREHGGSDLERIEFFDSRDGSEMRVAFRRKPHGAHEGRALYAWESGEDREIYMNHAGRVQGRWNRQPPSGESEEFFSWNTYFPELGFVRHAPLLAEVTRHVRRQLARVQHIGPLRQAPQRIYRPSRDQMSEVGRHGEHFMAVLKQQGPGAVRQLQWWLKRLEVPYAMEVVDLSAAHSGTQLALVLTDLRTRTPVTLPEVGYGVSQMLPILVAGISSSLGTICLEQPELHLHPRLQAELGDFLVETRQTNGCQWLIESHSETLVLRLKRRIREGWMSCNDVRVYYVESGNDGATISTLELDNEGNFTREWPQGFFDKLNRARLGGTI